MLRLPRPVLRYRPTLLIRFLSSPVCRWRLLRSTRLTRSWRLMDAGRVDELVNLLHSFGVQAVTDLKPEQMGAFATALRGMGAKI